MMTRFSRLLNGYMNEIGLSDSRLAWRIGVCRHTIIRWRNGLVERPNCDRVREVTNVLRLTPQERHELLRAARCQDRTADQFLPVIGKPVFSPKQFFGREELLGRMRRAWEKESLENVAVIGNRGSGKTSLLHYLEKIGTTSKNSLRPNQRPPKSWKDWLPKDFQFAIIDFCDAGMCDPEVLVRDVLQQLKLPTPEVCDLECFAKTLKQVEIPTIIMMDEVGAGLNSETLTPEFWYNLRSLAGHSPHLGFLMTARESVQVLAKNAGKPSPFFNLFGHTLELEAFTDDEAQDFLNHFPGKLSSKDRQWILDNSGGWPVFLQMICDERLIALEEKQLDEHWKVEALKRIKTFQESSSRPISIKNTSEVWQ